MKNNEISTQSMGVDKEEVEDRSKATKIVESDYKNEGRTTAILSIKEHKK